MSAGEEEKHCDEAIIKALTKALTDIKGSLMDSLNLQLLTGTHQNNTKTFDSSSRVWRAGTHSKVYLTRLVIPHDWSICSISWVPLEEGSTISGTPLE